MIIDDNYSLMRPRPHLQYFDLGKVTSTLGVMRKYVSTPVWLLRLLRVTTGDLTQLNQLNLLGGAT